MVDGHEDLGNVELSCIWWEEAIGGGKESEGERSRGVYREVYRGYRGV